jgi:hypothetical protein
MVLHVSKALLALILVHKLMHQLKLLLHKSLQLKKHLLLLKLNKI